jgi:hypothetical protein
VSRDPADLADRLGKVLVVLGVVLLAITAFGCGGLVGIRWLP